MKKLLQFILSLFIITIVMYAQTTLLTVDFETAGSGYTVSPGESNTNLSNPDYWIRTNGTTPVIYPSVAFTGKQGSYFFAGEDLDYDATQYYVTCNAVNVSSYESLQLKLLVGGAGSNYNKEGEEYLKIQYQYDSGGYTTLAQYLGNGNYYTEDANADGTVDGSDINTAMQEFTYSIPKSGTNLQIRILALNGGSEEIAFDNIRIIGTVASASQASNVNFYGTTTTSTTVNWDRGDGDNCAVFMTLTASGNSAPVNSTTYTANSVFGSGSQIGTSGWYCIYNGSGTSVSVTGLSSHNTYQVHVCEYNGGAGSELYTTDSGTNNPNNLTTLYTPTVTTQTVSDISTTSSTGNGNITDLGNPNPIQYGVCWNTTGTPTTSDYLTEEGSISSTGSFTTAMTNLSSSTTYFVRAYATNSVGTSYGDETSFRTTDSGSPSQTTLLTVDFETASDGYTSSPAESNNNDGSPDYWTRTDETSIASSVVFTNYEGSYFFAGEELDFDSGSTPFYIICDPVDVSSQVWLQIKILVGGRDDGATKEGEEFLKIQYQYDSGGYTTLAQFLGNGDYYSEDANADGTPEMTDINESMTEFAYTIPLVEGASNLQIRIYAYNGASEEIAFDNIRIMGIAATASTVTTQAISDISTTTSTGNGNITDLGNPNPTAHGVCWNTTGTPTISDSKTDEGAASSTGAFTSSMTGLTANTTYFVRAYATNTAGTSYGDQVSFITDPEAVTITTQAVSDISTTTATGNGNITDLGNPNPTAHGVCWNTTGTPTISDSKTNEGAASSTGAFTSSMTSLTANTTYYVRTYATNTAGTSYGAEVSFTTDSDVSLPVELTTFFASAENQSVVVGWEVESETNNVGYILEKKLENSLEFDIVASYKTNDEMVGKGSTSQKVVYSFTDYDVNYGKSYTYRLSDVSTTGKQTTYAPLTIIMENAPELTKMNPAYPNPFNPKTFISYQIAETSPVTISVYDMLGRDVRTLYNGNQSIGSYHVYWDGKNDNGVKVSTGSYIIRMQTKGKTEIQKVLFTK